MKILVFGSSGCIGSAVVRALRWRGHRVVETTPDALRHRHRRLRARPQRRRRSSPSWRRGCLRSTSMRSSTAQARALPTAANPRADCLHGAGPIALFRAAECAGIGRVVDALRARAPIATAAPRSSAARGAPGAAPTTRCSASVSTPRSSGPRSSTGPAAAAPRCSQVWPTRRSSPSPAAAAGACSRSMSSSSPRRSPRWSSGPARRAASTRSAAPASSPSASC